METGLRKNRLLSLFGKKGALLILILFIVFNIVVTPHFFSMGTFNNLIIQMTPVLLTGLGLTWVIASGGIDVSVGSVMALASIISAKAMVPTAEIVGTGGWGWCLPAGLAMVIGIVVGMLVGVLMGVIIAKFHIQPIVVSLAFMISIRGIAQIINDSMMLEFHDPAYTFIGRQRLFGTIPIQFLIMVIAIVVIWFVSNRMAIGRYVQSVGGNFTASYLMGIKTTFIIILVYAVSAFFASVAGIIKTAELSAADANGIGLLIEMDAIAAVVIGGTPMNGGRPKILGTVTGAIIIVLVNISVNMNNIPFAYAQVFKAIIIVLVLWTQNMNIKRQGA